MLLTGACGLIGGAMLKSRPAWSAEPQWRQDLRLYNLAPVEEFWKELINAVRQEVIPGFEAELVW